MSAAAVSQVDLASHSTTLEPYGQLIRMLMPRAQSIAIYDRMGVPAWMSDGRDVPELRRLRTPKSQGIHRGTVLENAQPQKMQSTADTRGSRRAWAPPRRA